MSYDVKFKRVMCNKRNYLMSHDIFISGIKTTYWRKSENW